MVTKASRSQSTGGTRPIGGQNKPPSGGPAGAGKARGQANLSSTARTTPGGRGPVPKAK